MVAIDELYAMLTADKVDDQRSLRAASTGQQTPAGEIVVALDGSGFRHLLIPAGAMNVSPDVRSRGVRLIRRELHRDGRPYVYADLECREPRLGLVFERLVGDILRRVEQTPSNALVIVHQTLDQWRDLLRSADSTLDREMVLGLAGELELLALLGELNPARALDSWRGPERTTHDFSLADRAIEAKSTASADGNVVQMSNLDQLDPQGLESLHLAVVHFRELDTGLSLDDRIRALIAGGFPEGRLIHACSNAGYVFESDDSSLPRFSMRSIRLWKIGADFPGLRRSDILEGRMKGVARVRYELALDSAPSPLREPEGRTALREWVAT